MPVLANPRHEKFAAGLADGKSQEEAYVAAGYSPKGASSASNKLCKGNASIYQRRDEIIAQREIDAKEARALAAREASYDRARIIRTLEEIVDRSMQYSPVTDDKGNAVLVQLKSGEFAAAYTFDGKVATNALKLLGQEQPIPMFVKREDRPPSLLDDIPPDMLRLIAARLGPLVRWPAGLMRIQDETIIEPEPRSELDRPATADNKASAGA